MTVPTPAFFPVVSVTPTPTPALPVPNHLEVLAAPTSHTYIPILLHLRQIKFVLFTTSIIY